MFKRITLVSLGISAIMLFSMTVCGSYAQTPEEESLKKGIDLTRHDKFDEAISEFNKVIASDPKSASAYYNLGFTYDRKGDLAKAIANFSKAIEIDPTLTDAYYNRGFAYYKKGSFDNAVADYNKVIEISPTAADAYYGRGLVYSQKGELDKAIAEYTQAIKARPNFALAYDARAVAYVNKKNYLAALADVNKAQSLGFRSRRPRAAQGGQENIGEIAVGINNNKPSSETPMQTLALITAGIIFLLVSFLHLLRLIFRVRVLVGKFTVPLWFSVIGLIIPLILSFWIFKAISIQ